MTGKRKVTVAVTTHFVDMAMESTDDALNIIKGIMLTHGRECQDEIKRALEDAGAKDVTIQLAAY